MHLLTKRAHTTIRIQDPLQPRTPMHSIFQGQIVFGFSRIAIWRPRISRVSMPGSHLLHSARARTRPLTRQSLSSSLHALNLMMAIRSQSTGLQLSGAFQFHLQLNEKCLTRLIAGAHLLASQ